MRPTPPLRLALAPTLTMLLTVAALHGACAPDSGIDGGSTGATSSTTSGAGGTLFEGGAGGSLPDPDAACALVTEEAVSVPLNLYIMMDKSSSMFGDKWTSAKAGLTAFVNDPKFAGIRVAIRFFPRPADGVPACDQVAYKTPVVDYGPLPQNAAPIIAAIEAVIPDGFDTPIYPALGGALLKGIEVAENNPGEASAVMLVTDGQPQGPAASCGGVDPEDPAAIADLAAAGASFDPPVLTYVIGLPGVNQSIANQIAAAGGTDAAVLVGATNVAAEFQAALGKVTGEALPCEFEVPSQVAGGDVSFSAVNVLLTVDGGATTTLPQSADCSGAGWHYDNPAAPTKIVLCPATCSAVKEASSAKIEILLGCQTVVE